MPSLRRTFPIVLAALLPAGMARALPAADLSGAFDGLRADLSSSRAALDRRRDVERAIQDLVERSFVLMADGDSEPLALAYDPEALERVERVEAEDAGDFGRLREPVGNISPEEFERKTVRLYVDLTRQAGFLLYPPDRRRDFPVSTGNGNMRGGVWTPPGHYDVEREIYEKDGEARRGKFRQYPMWYSKQADGAPMPDALFFKDGKAAHSATGGGIARLGTTAQSHGCVRLPPDVARELRELALRHGPENVGFYVYGVEPSRGAAPRPASPTRPHPSQPLPAPPLSIFESLFGHGR